MELDPLTHAVRADLADVRLADRIFAPHYAEAIVRRLASPTPLRAQRDPTSQQIAALEPGTRFELLDLIGGDAWGVADGRVGWLPADRLAG